VVGGERALEAVRFLSSNPVKFVANSTSHSFLHMNIAGFVARTKYYSVWCIAYASFFLSNHSNQR
jgi:hypothetical protein